MGPVAPVSVVPVCPVAGCCLVSAPVSVSCGSSISRLRSGCNASESIDNYQKRRPVENVLESTGDSHVVVSNRVRGKHYCVGKSAVAQE